MTSDLLRSFATMSETIGAVLGPSLVSLGVTRRDRLDARGAHPLRVAVAEWMGALGVSAEFRVYIGGADALGVHAAAGEPERDGPRNCDRGSFERKSTCRRCARSVCFEARHDGSVLSRRCDHRLPGCRD